MQQCESDEIAKPFYAGSSEPRYKKVERCGIRNRPPREKG